MVRLDGRAYSEDKVESVDAAGEGAEFSESGESGEDVIGAMFASTWGVWGAVVCLAVQLRVPSGAVTDGSWRDSLTVRTVQWGDGMDSRIGLEMASGNGGRHDTVITESEPQKGGGWVPGKQGISQERRCYCVVTICVSQRKLR